VRTRGNAHAVETVTFRFIGRVRIWGSRKCMMPWGKLSTEREISGYYLRPRFVRKG
jgi:hypothetical protein